MSTNGGFPPLKYEKLPKNKERTKERTFASTKNVDIKHILSIELQNQMVGPKKDKIEVIESF